MYKNTLPSALFGDGEFEEFRMFIERITAQIQVIGLYKLYLRARVVKLILYDVGCSIAVHTNCQVGILKLAFFSIIKSIRDEIERN